MNDTELARFGALTPDYEGRTVPEVRAACERMPAREDAGFLLRQIGSFEVALVPRRRNVGSNYLTLPRRGQLLDKSVLWC